MKVKCPTCGKEIEYSSANPMYSKCDLRELGEHAKKC